jgi:hypothetical protein
MKSKLLFDIAAANDYSNAFTLGKFASIAMVANITLPTSANGLWTGNIKITRDGDETHNVDLIDLIDFDNMKEGMPTWVLSHHEGGDDTLRVTVRLPFQYDGAKGVIRNSLDVSKCNDTMFLFTHGNAINSANGASTLRVYGELTLHEEIFRPYMLPYSTSATASEQNITIQRKNIALLYIRPNQGADVIEVCVNGQLVEHVYALDFIDMSTEYWNVEHLTPLTWGMINLLPGGLPQELDNGAQVKIIQTTAASTKIYAFGFTTPLTPSNCGCGC